MGNKRKNNTYIGMNRKRKQYFKKLGQRLSTCLRARATAAAVQVESTNNLSEDSWNSVPDAMTNESERLQTDESIMENDSNGLLSIDDESSHEQRPKSALAVLDHLEVTGRRIVDFAHIFNELKDVAQHPSMFECGLNTVQIVSEQTNGFISKFTLQCSMCRLVFTVKSDLFDKKDRYNINQAAVAGMMAIGCGQSQLQELAASMELPIMTDQIYKNAHEVVSDGWEQTATESMEKAAAREREASIAECRVDKNGIAIIDVIADGCWSKRSYKTNYSALSGAAAVVGRRFGEVLFLAVKNKYCSICARAEKTNVTPKEHTCYKNYNGPSTGMESAILVEAFKTSIERQNLIYGRLISDGDASVYSKIIQARPYPNYTVEKIECRNHILRNLSSKLSLLSSDTRYPIEFRKIITKERILSMRKAICVAIKHNKDSGFNIASKIEHLYGEIMTAPYHAFSFHKTCKSHLCLKFGIDNTNFSLDFFKSVLWQKIIFLITHVAAHSRSLIHDVDNNTVERFNSVIAKVVGGKRINFSLRRSYQARCAAAVVSYNTKRPLATLYRNMTGMSPKGHLKKLEDMKERRKEKSKNYSRKKKRLQTFAPSDKDYGEQCQKQDMDKDCYEMSKKIFLDNLKKDDQERTRIERETILQSECSEWLELRRNMITASNFGKIVKRRPDVSCVSLVKSLLYPPKLDNVISIKHGRENEKVALRQLSQQENIKIEACGLYIDKEFPFLGASPDSICKERNIIIEIKCPLSAYKLGLENAIAKKKINFWKKNRIGILEVNRNSDWFYQAQGQLHVTEMKICLFGVWTGSDKPIKIEYIHKDDRFWKEIMETKLHDFYMDCIVPEIIDPRVTRNMTIKNPPHIEAAISRKKEALKRKRNEEVNKENVVEKEFSAPEPSSSLLNYKPTCSRILHFKEM